METVEAGSKSIEVGVLVGLPVFGCVPCPLVWRQAAGAGGWVCRRMLAEVFVGQGALPRLCKLGGVSKRTKVAHPHALARASQVAVMERDTGLRILTDEEVDVVVKEVEEEKAAAEAAKRAGASGAAGR